MSEVQMLLPPAHHGLEEGSKVEGNYRGRGEWFPGVISRDHGNGTIDIDYDDGDKELGVGRDLVRPVKPVKPVKPAKAATTPSMSRRLSSRSSSSKVNSMKKEVSSIDVDVSTACIFSSIEANNYGRKNPPVWSQVFTLYQMEQPRQEFWYNKATKEYSEEGPQNDRDYYLRPTCEEFYGKGDLDDMESTFTEEYVFCYIIVLPSFLVCDVSLSLSLLSMYCSLLAFSDTT
jgi:hypothetical protein